MNRVVKFDTSKRKLSWEQERALKSSKKHHVNRRNEKRRSTKREELE